MRAGLRWAILLRDGFTCRYCGRHAPSAELHVDHVISQRDGGKDAPINLVTACAPCNIGKGSKSLRDVPVSRDMALSLLKFHQSITEELARRAQRVLDQHGCACETCDELRARVENTGTDHEAEAREHIINMLLSQ